MRRLYVKWGLQFPRMVDVMHKVPKHQVSQPSHFPGAEGLTEAGVENLLEVSIVIIIQLIHSNEDVASEVSYVNLPLMKKEMLDSKWEMGRGSCPSLLSPLLASLYCQGWGRAMRQGLSCAELMSFINKN